MRYVDKMKKRTMLSSDFDLEKFIELWKMYASERVNTANNNGADSVSGFIGWIVYLQDDKEE